MLSDFVAAEAQDQFDAQLMNLGLVEAFLPFLKSGSVKTKKATIWTLSNLAVGNADLKKKIG